MTLVFLCLLSANIYGTFKQPYAGLTAEKRGPDWIVSKVDPNGMGIRNGVRRGDLIWAVNNRPPDDFFNLKWGELEGFQSAEILPPSGQPKTIILSGEPFSVSLLAGLPVLLLSMAFFILGLIALTRTGNQAAAEEIFWLNAAMAVAMIISPISARSILPATLLELTCFGCLSFLLVRLAMAFPVENKTPTAKRVFRLSLAISLAVLAFALAAFLVWPGLMQTIRNLLFINALLGLVFSLVIINNSLRSTSYGFVRNQLMLVLMGIIISISPFLILSAIPTIIARTPLVSSEKTSLFIIFIPLTIVYVLSNTYLPSASYLLRKLAINLVIALPEAAIIAGLIRLVLAYKGLSIYEILISVLAVLLAFIYSYGRLQERLEEIIFPGQVSYKGKLSQISNSLTGISNLDSLGAMLSESIAKNMSLDGTVFMLKKGEEVAVLSTAGRYKGNPAEVAFLRQYFLDLKQDPDNPSLPKGYPAAFLIFLSKDDYRIGLFLGFEMDKSFLSSEELSLIAAVGKQVLLAVENIELLGVLEQKVKQEQEQARNLRLLHHIAQRKIEDERRAIAREIHDGPLQTAIHVLRLAREYPCKKLNVRESATEELPGIEENIQDLIYELRNVCTELRPPILDDLGFLPAVEWLVKKLMIEENIEIVVGTKGINNSVRLDRDIEIAAFRLVQEMLNNAIKHSGANLAQVTIRLNKNLIIKVSDNGKGFNADCPKIDRLHENKFGLIGMEERVRQLGGRLKISSRPGKGTTIVLFIPTDKMDGRADKEDENVGANC
jgi:two-component system sensor histidine kinase ComP